MNIKLVKQNGETEDLEITEEELKKYELKPNEKLQKINGKWYKVTIPKELLGWYNKLNKQEIEELYNKSKVNY